MQINISRDTIYFAVDGAYFYVCSLYNYNHTAYVNTPCTIASKISPQRSLLAHFKIAFDFTRDKYHDFENKNRNFDFKERNKSSNYPKHSLIALHGNLKL